MHKQKRTELVSLRVSEEFKEIFSLINKNHKTSLSEILHEALQKKAIYSLPFKELEAYRKKIDGLTD